MRDHYDFFLDQDTIPQDLDIIVNNIGFSHNQPNYSHGYDRREYYILHYIIGGSGTYTVNDVTYNLSKNDGFIVPPDTTVIYRADIKDPWSVYWVGFHGQKAGYYLSRIGIDISHPTFHLAQNEHFIDCMEKLYSEIQSPIISHESILGHFYQAIGVMQKGTIPEETQYQPQYYYKNALHLIEHNIRFPFKVSDLANELGLSPSHTYRIIKKECGLTPHELIEKMKAEKACQMLKDTNISIHEISLLLGYEYVSHFSLTFKRVMKTTPAAYRQKHQGNI